MKHDLGTPVDEKASRVKASLNFLLIAIELNAVSEPTGISYSNRIGKVLYPPNTSILVFRKAIGLERYYTQQTLQFTMNLNKTIIASQDTFKSKAGI